MHKRWGKTQETDMDKWVEELFENSSLPALAVAEII